MFDDDGDDAFGFDPSELQDLNPRPGMGHMGLPQDVPEDMNPRQQAFAQGVSDAPAGVNGTSFWDKVSPQNVESVIGAAGQVATGYQQIRQAQTAAEIARLQAERARADQAYKQRIAMIQAQGGGSSFFSRNWKWIVLGVVVVGGAAYFMSRRRRR